MDIFKSLTMESTTSASTAYEAKKDLRATVLDPKNPQKKYDLRVDSADNCLAVAKVNSVFPNVTRVEYRHVPTGNYRILE